MNARRAIPAALLVAGAICAAPAGAATYCAHQDTGCPQGTIDVGSDVEQALQSAASSDEGDLLLVGPGTWIGPWQYNAGSDLDIEGAGRDQTTVTALSGASDQVLYAGRASVSGLHIRIPANDFWTGLTVGQDSRVTDISIDRSPGAAKGVTGIHLHGDAHVTRANVTLPQDSHSDRAVKSTGNGSSFVTESTLTGRVGLDAVATNSGVTLLTRSTVEAVEPIRAVGTRVSIDNSVLRSGAAAPAASALRCTGAHDAALSADHVTIVGDAPVAVKSECPHNGHAASLALTNSIATQPNGFIRFANAGGEADVGIAYSNLHIGNSPSGGTGSAGVAASIDADPQFAPGTLRPQAGSPVIDTGAPGAAQPLDLCGAARIIGAKQDMGAFEFDPNDPPNAPAPGAEQPLPGGAQPPATGGPVVPAVGVTNADLLRGLRATLVRKPGRRGATYRHRFLLPGTLTIRWTAKGRGLAVGSRRRTAAGRVVLRMYLTTLGRRVLGRRGRVRITVSGTLKSTGRKAVRASRKVVLRAR